MLNLEIIQKDINKKKNNINIYDSFSQVLPNIIFA